MTSIDAHDEYLDLVDDKDNVVSRKKRSEVEAEKLSNFRVINMFLVNSKRELWIPRRTAHKKLFPLCLDVSAGGHVESGETYEEALQRETMEELNINLDNFAVKFLGHLTPMKNRVSAFMKAYEINQDFPPDYNPDDFFEYSWMSPEHLLNKIANGEKAKGDLEILVSTFYGS